MYLKIKMDENTIKEFLRLSNYRHVRDQRQKLKEKLVIYKGGKCEICGYNRCISALDFHHLDPSKKDFGIAKGNVMSFDKAKKEVDKCILVCATCHREIHHNLYKEKYDKEEQLKKDIYAEILNNRDIYGNIPIRESYKFLAYTSIMDDISNNVKREDIFKKYHINNKTFNLFLKENGIQYNKNKYIDNKPSKDELIELLKDNSKSAIGRMFGVSCSSVIKWCKKYGLV